MTWRLQLPRVRTILLGLSLLALVQLGLAITGFWQATRNAEQGFAFPAPDRIAFIVETVEQTPPDRQAALIAAVSDDRLTVEILPTKAFLAEVDSGQDMPAVARVIKRYVDRLDNRQVMTWISVDLDEQVSVPRFETGRLYSQHPLRMAISLSDGRWLVAETRGDLARMIFGFPPGLWAGLLGVSVALLSLVLLWQSLAPLPSLARGLREFAEDQKPKDVDHKGPAEVREIAGAVEAMQLQIATLLDDRLNMLGALAHDLRTYLTRLRLRAEGINDAEQQSKAIADIESMQAMSETALEFARLGTEPVRLQQVSVLPLMRDITERNDVEVRGNDDDLYLGMIDVILFESVIENLVANAKKHGGGACLSVSRSVAEIRVDVDDNGPGFPQNNGGIERLLAPFTRGDTARTLDTPGVGLGLAIVKRATALQNGRLKLSNRPEGGARVSVYFPAAREDRST